MQRFSRKRESILEILRSTDEHPGAEWIYAKVKSIYPDISLATIYRNLNQLKAEGLIRSMGVIGGQERFDACLDVHNHAICRVCGKIVDIENFSVPEIMVKNVESMTGFEITCPEVQFSGVCENCKKKIEEEKLK